MEKVFKVGDFASFKGSDSWCIVLEIIKRDKSNMGVFVKPICGTYKWTHPTRGIWSVGMSDLVDIPPHYKDLVELLYGL